jgi:PAS domain S-box-containing protein
MELAAYNEAEALTTLPAKRTSNVISSKLGQILVVDDEVELKNALVEMLNAQGYDALGCASGQEALSALRKQNFDVLLSDLMMPGMDGVALLHTALEIDQHLVCIIMTGQGTIQTAVEAMKVGAFDYVLKPFRLQALLPALTRAINLRRLNQENLQLRETVAIHELCQTIAFTLDPRTVLSKLADAAHQQSEADEVSILLPTDDGSDLYVAAVRGENRERLLGERVPLEQSISSWVARERLPLLLKGQINDPRFTALWPRSDISSAISVPLQVAGKLVGIININTVSSPRPFTLGQMKALTILASTAAAALESASLYGQVRQAEEKYRSIFDNAVEGIFQSTPEGRFITVNPSLARILGYDSPEEVIETITDITYQLYVDPERRAEATCLQEESGVLQGFEFEAYRKDGEKIWLSLNRRSIRDGNGVEIYREGSIEDITERKRAEEALRASEAELRALFAAMTDVILVLDAEGRYQKIAPTDPAYLFKPSADLLGKRLHEIFPKEEVDFFLAHIRRALDEGQMHRVEYSLQISGAQVWFDGSVSPMSKDSVIWIARDITERKQAEAMRRESEEKYRSIVETANEGIWLINAEACTSFVNQQMAAMLGYTVAEMLGRPAFDFIFPADFALVEQIIAQRQQGTSDTNEFRLRRKDGSAIVTLYNATPTKNQAGEVVGSLSMVIDITERKRAEEALKESEVRFQSAFDHAPIGIALVAPDGRFVQVNHSFCEILGYTKEELLASDVLGITHKDDIVATIEYIRGLISGEVKTNQLEKRYLHKLGHEVLALTNLSLVRDAENKPQHIIAQIQDITERKRVEEALRASEERYRVVAETATDVIITIDENSTILFANGAVERVFGHTVSELLGHQITMLMPNYQRRVHKAAVRRYARTGRKHINWESVELPGLHKSGREIPLELSFGEFSKDGKRFFTGIARDITERKRAEEALLQSEQRYRLLFKLNPQPMWVFDLETLAFLEVNEAAIHHYGYSREEFLAMTIKDIRPAEDIPTLLDNISRRMPQHEEAGVWKHKKKDGTIIDVEITTHELTFYGKLAQIVLAYDVTERRSLEEQLRQSQKLEAVGQLAGGVAHDFNNLLTVITGYSDLSLRRLDKDNPIRSNLEEIKKAGERAASLTRQLLAFSRKQVLQPKMLQLNSIVADVDKMLRRLIGEDIDAMTLLEPSLGQIKADPGQIEQVLLNLAVNARDAMPQGGKLTIETANVYLDNQYARRHTAIQPGNYVMLAVSDTGCGMDAETQARMFEPFFTTKEQGKGTGLGLSTVYGIVNQSGGHLWVYSEVGRGTTFKIYLPRVDEVTEMNDVRETTLAVLPQGQETVLLTEDEEQVRHMIRMILEMSGYRVLEADSGDEALAIYKQHDGQIDLVMTDVVMPQMSGRELAQRVEILHPGIKVLYMSGYTDDAIVHHGLLDQEIAFLQKPFTPDVLMRKVREVLDAPHED